MSAPSRLPAPKSTRPASPTAPLYGIKVTGVLNEENGTIANGNFTLQEMGVGGDVSNLTGAALQTESVAEGVTGFLRPEDAAWDPDHPNVLYFVTTNGFGQPSRLYQATFVDIANRAIRRRSNPASC